MLLPPPVWTTGWNSGGIKSKCLVLFPTENNPSVCLHRFLQSCVEAQMGHSISVESTYCRLWDERCVVNQMVENLDAPQPIKEQGGRYAEGVQTTGRLCKWASSSKLDISTSYILTCKAKVRCYLYSIYTCRY